MIKSVKIDLTSVNKKIIDASENRIKGEVIRSHDDQSALMYNSPLFIFSTNSVRIDNDDVKFIVGQEVI
jgi:hypothetical protein